MWQRRYLGMLVLGLIAVVTSLARASTLEKNVSTGYDNATGQFIPIGDPDDDWQMIQTPDELLIPTGPALSVGTYRRPNPPPGRLGGWIDPEPDGYRWIGHANSHSSVRADNPPGFFLFRTTFDLPAEAHDLRFIGSFSVDRALELTLNGHTIVGQTETGQSQRTFNVWDQSHFNVGGENMIEARVYNGGFQMGLALGGWVRSDMPEPSSLALLLPLLMLGRRSRGAARR